MIFLRVFIILMGSVIAAEAFPIITRFFKNRHYKSLIEGSMDIEADPCDNFYQYACGKWEEFHQVSSGKRKNSQMLTMTDYEVNRELAQHLNAINLKNKPKFVKTAYAFYKSCIGVQQFDHFSYLEWMKTLENLMLPKLWTARSSRSQLDWIQTLGIMRRYGLNGIFIEETMMHRRDDNTRTIIDLDKPVEGRGFVSLTYENLQNLLKYLDMPSNSKTFEKLWQDISEFEKRLEELQEIEDEEGTKLITVKDLPLPWLHSYLTTVLGHTTLDPDMELYIQNIGYMEDLYELLKKYNSHFINRYLEVRFLWHLQQNSPRTFEPVECIDAARNLMPLAMHWLYQQQHPEIEDYSENVQQMFDNIIGHFSQTLRANNMHFNETILNYLSEKLTNIQLKVGNLPRFDTVAILESYYEHLDLNPNDFYGNHLKTLNFNFKAFHAGHPNTLSRNASQFFNLEIYGEGSSSSPYFLTRANIVIVPFTTLREPLFHPDYEEVYKYSALGSSLAHEIFHGFDRMGLSVDFRGKMNAWQFNTVLSNPEFGRNYKCLCDLYSDVVDEKIADISGLHYAYGAFFNRYPSATIQTRKLKGVEMSMKKVFFLNFAQLYCDPNVSDVEHGEVSERINDALSHFREFSRAFSCSRRGRMLPMETCQVWR